MYHIFYHKADLDGKCSAAIARHFCETKRIPYTLYPFDYSDDIPPDADIFEADKIFFLDVSMNPYSKINELHKRYPNIVFVDHHKTFIESEDFKTFTANSELKSLVEVGKGACELTWEYFFKFKEVPEFVKLLSTYDVWKDADKPVWNERTLPFQYGMRLENVEPESPDSVFIKLLNDDSNTDFIRTCISTGKIIIKYEKIQNAQMAKGYAFEALFEGKTWICLNARGNSSAFDSIFDPDKHVGMLRFGYTPKGYNISLYSKKGGIDTSVISTKYDGGGHAQASGFLAKQMKFDGTTISFSNKETE